MSIYLYGDLHRYIDLDPLVEASYEEFSIDYSKDILIILGDFGGFWYGDERDTEFIEDLENELPFKEILFLDGNHESFQSIYNLPTTTKYGNTVGVAGKKTYHLKRGLKYTIEEKTFFIMGGATSIDKIYRKEGISWWPEEMPSKEEYETALDTLEENGYTFDYILTHCTANSIQYAISKSFKQTDELTKFLDIILPDLKYKHWYFGHYHCNTTIDEYKATCIYRKLIKIE